jgi:hypothetical protein
MEKEPFLVSKTVMIPNTVKVHSDLAIFVTSAGSMAQNDKGANFKVFKKNNGKWYTNDFVSQAGMPVSGKMRMPDKGREELEVDTKYTVVDVQNTNGNVHVVLRDADGNLVTRDSSTDKDSPEIKVLQKQLAMAPAAAATTGTPGAPGVFDPNDPAQASAPVTGRVGGTGTGAQPARPPARGSTPPAPRSSGTTPTQPPAPRGGVQPAAPLRGN